MTDRNPQAEQMAHESMIRCLTAQTEAIWPQERPLLERYPLPEAPDILDVGSGTGEFSLRAAELFPGSRVTGVELHGPHVALSRERGAGRQRVRFVQGDAFALSFPADSFDLTACRHVLQAVPEPERILAEMIRVTRPGGWIHAIVEDYGMMHFHPATDDTDRFWSEGPMEFARKTGSDLRVGRQAYSLLRGAGLRDVTVDYVVVDTLRVPRETFAAIWEAWRDGYSEAIVEHTRFTEEEVAGIWKDMIGTLRDPAGYGVWFVPVAGGRVG